MDAAWAKVWSDLELVFVDPSLAFDHDMSSHPRPLRRVYVAIPIPTTRIVVQEDVENTKNSKTKPSTAKTRPALPLRPSTQQNQAVDKKRKHEDDKDAKEPIQKRRQVVKPAKKSSEPPKANSDPSKLAAPTPRTSEAPAKPVVPKKAPQPLWTRVGAGFTRREIEDRILLREFVIRFNDSLDIKRVYLERLEDFDTFDDATAKALLVAFLEVVKTDLTSDQRRPLNDFLKELRDRGMTFYDILSGLDKMRQKTGLNIPSLTKQLKQPQDEIDSEALIPVLLALVDDLLDTRALRAQVDKYKDEGVEVRKEYFAAAKAERERWSSLRSSLMEEKKVGGKGFDQAKWKQKFEAAKAKHDAKDHSIRLNFLKKQASISLRFTPQVDMDGRVYYFHTPSLRKPPAKSTRDDYGKWCWFVPVWGRRPDDAERVDEPTGSKNTVESWWGFGEAAECKLLAKWIQFRTEQSNNKAGSDRAGESDDSSDLTDLEDDEDVGKTDSKQLVAALLDFATVLDYADDVGK